MVVLKIKEFDVVFKGQKRRYGRREKYERRDRWGFGRKKGGQGRADVG